MIPVREDTKGVIIYPEYLPPMYWMASSRQTPLLFAISSEIWVCVKLSHPDTQVVQVQFKLCFTPCMHTVIMKSLVFIGYVYIIHLSIPFKSWFAMKDCPPTWVCSLCEREVPGCCGTQEFKVLDIATMLNKKTRYTWYSLIVVMCTDHLYIQVIAHRHNMYINI